MSERYPRFRYPMEDGTLAVSDAMEICFFMQRSHGDMAQAIVNTLATFRQAVGPEVLCWYIGAEGVPQKLDEPNWRALREELLDPRWRPACTVRIHSQLNGGADGFYVEYKGQWLDNILVAGDEDAISLISFRLPTEYLEEQGPGRIKALALSLARELPFNSGYATLAFSVLDVLGAERPVRSHCFRYPGMDVHAVTGLIFSLGTRVRGVYWLNFLGPPVLDSLGGASNLRSRLHPLDTSVEELSG